MTVASHSSTTVWSLQLLLSLRWRNWWFPTTAAATTDDCKREEVVFVVRLFLPDGCIGRSKGGDDDEDVMSLVFSKSFSSPGRRE
jgi:hypothetical protein